MTDPLNGERWRVDEGDCLEWLRGLPDGCADFVFTDPPYGHNNQAGDLQAARVRDAVKGARVADLQPIANDGPDEMRAVVDGALEAMVPVLKRDCCCCCCCCGGGGPKPTFAWTAERMDKKGLDFFHAVVWDKSLRGHGMGWRYRRDYEFVMVAHRTGGRLAWTDNDIAVPNIVRIMPAIVRDHPNAKPVELVEYFLRLHTHPGDLVIDPFCGQGTTGEACLRMGRRFLGCDLDPHWTQVARERLGYADRGLIPPARPRKSNSELQIALIEDGDAA